MTLIRYLIPILLIFSLTVSLITIADGFPASSFNQENGDWYDNWGINRNNAVNNEYLIGFLPNLAYETLGDNKEWAYSIGEWFQNHYSSKSDRAVAILKYVQTWTEYGSDSDNFIRNGVPQDEWAQNADEFARSFNETTGVKAIGDCEDMAFLCGTIYVGAGFDVAIVDAIDHAALLIWLPEFSNANDYWDINDGRGEGWIWVEATSSTNPVGWTPPDFEYGEWSAYPITDSSVFVNEPESFFPTSTLTGLDTLSIIIGILFVIITILSRLMRVRY